ncbi:hypothetical protein [Janthinobacterium violaceinigrum]|uniref:Uncharacterized protein n=1 Tax=Janthinobacterium violaceinigrum TaxID=2654252 RepID=A0A6I1I064_9BURK|nr:hypothetical protein [Janthinobacterium violaceinigrum]KAB8062909.1 hypothetical protein GCN75_21195 [Janthinobacterium violaceinigrum]
MKAFPVLPLLALLLGGCGFAPPNAYPIFRMPSSAEGDALTMSVEKDTLFGAPTTLEQSKMLLLKQRFWYLKLAEDSQRAVYNQSDWALTGGAIGTAGGLLKSLPTAALGAVIGGGAGLVASRYSLDQQSTLYARAADKVACLSVVLSSYEQRKRPFATAITWPDSIEQQTTSSLNFAWLAVLAELRTSLQVLKPQEVSIKQVIDLRDRYASNSILLNSTGNNLSAALLQQEQLRLLQQGQSRLIQANPPSPEAQRATEAAANERSEAVRIAQQAQIAALGELAQAEIDSCVLIGKSRAE